MRLSNNMENKIHSDIYVWKFRLTVLQNKHWNTVRTRCLWHVSVGYDLYNKFGSYRNVKIRVHGKVLNNQFCFIRCRRQHLRALNRDGITDIPLLRTPLQFVKAAKAKFLESARLFCFISKSKSGSVKKSFVMITSLPEFHFRCRMFILLVQTKVVAFISYYSSTSGMYDERIH